MVEPHASLCALTSSRMPLDYGNRNSSSNSNSSRHMQADALPLGTCLIRDHPYEKARRSEFAPNHIPLLTLKASAALIGCVLVVGAATDGAFKDRTGLVDGPLIDVVPNNVAPIASVLIDIVLVHGARIDDVVLFDALLVDCVLVAGALMDEALSFSVVHVASGAR